MTFTNANERQIGCGYLTRSTTRKVRDEELETQEKEGDKGNLENGQPAAE